MKRTCFLLTALLAACALPTGRDDVDVEYDVDRASYQRNQDVSAVLVNASDQEAGYNLCLSALEKRTGGGFRRVERTPEHPCMLILLRLAPGETATYREPASAFPGPGTYRLRTTIETPISGRSVDVVTEPFVVGE